MKNPIYATWMVSNNIGDVLTPWLIIKFTGDMPLYVPFTCQFPKYMLSGSILNHAVKYTTVWGAGVARKDDKIAMGVDIRSVRGPLTARKVRVEAGNDVQVCGDPAWLMPRYYEPRHSDGSRNLDYDVGIVPHYLHQAEVARWIEGRKDIKLINVFDTPEKFVDEICSCSVIYSSSLHGLIIADAYGIPSQWIECTAELGGDGMKFYDHLFVRDYIVTNGIYAPAKLKKFIVAEAAELLDMSISEPIKPLHLQQLPATTDLLYDLIKDKPVPTPDARKAFCDWLWNVCPFNPDPAIEPETEAATEPEPISIRAEKKLSVLILTVPEREEKLERLLTVLRPQLPSDDSVEIIVKEELHASQGGPTVGANRNAAVADAVGDYVCFVDDDDMVPEYYVTAILSAISPKQIGDKIVLPDNISIKHGTPETPPDVVGFKGHYIFGVNKPQLFIHTMEYKEWKTIDGVHQRCPNHINPVKRELALQCPYPEKNHGEDQDYSMALLPLLKTEVMINEIMYFYLKD